mmetsp:Transcript_8565/g.12814  ORF Transcript_8565/g.12814 Transcript_8565/m.12814 type:complete len:352 (-) Transcript_8565:137-1192(-)
MAAPFLQVFVIAFYASIFFLVCTQLPRKMTKNHSTTAWATFVGSLSATIAYSLYAFRPQQWQLIIVLVTILEGSSLVMFAHLAHIFSVTMCRAVTFNMERANRYNEGANIVFISTMCTGSFVYFVSVILVLSTNRVRWDAIRQAVSGFAFTVVGGFFVFITAQLRFRTSWEIDQISQSVRASTSSLSDERKSRENWSISEKDKSRYNTLNSSAFGESNANAFSGTRQSILDHMAATAASASVDSASMEARRKLLRKARCRLNAFLTLIPPLVIGLMLFDLYLTVRAAQDANNFSDWIVGTGYYKRPYYDDGTAAHDFGVLLQGAEFLVVMPYYYKYTWCWKPESSETEPEG